MCHPKLAVSLCFPLRYCSCDRDSREVSRGASIEHHMHRGKVMAEVPKMMSYVTHSHSPSHRFPRIHNAFSSLNKLQVYLFLILLCSIYDGTVFYLRLKYKSDTTAMHFNEVIYNTCYRKDRLRYQAKTLINDNISS